MKIKKNKNASALIIFLIIFGFALFIHWSGLLKYLTVQNSNLDSKISNVDFTNSKFKYSFSYPSTFSLHTVGSNPSESKLVQLSNQNEGQLFKVIIVSKSPLAEEYDGSQYDPFTSEIEKVIKSPIGKMSYTVNKSPYTRLPNEIFAGKEVKVFKWYQSKRMVLESKDYYYIIDVEEGKESNLPISTFKFL